ncbi:EAL domain-containing protein [Vreelandella zhanjiangensis]|uniref:EAL domain-containing protein n=1 Tax=Vreelandella zhanjiangensis TaxID=1121960 RepID=UPI00037EA4F2|nr:EAL domain-containing protein [Halomonas zhanjiangensis]
MPGVNALVKYDEDKQSERLSYASFRRQRRNVYILYILASLLLCSLFAWLLYEQRQQELSSAESRSAARASIINEWVKSVFSQSSQALLSVEEFAELQGMPVEGATGQMVRALNDRHHYAPLIQEIGLLDGQGTVLASSGNNRYQGIGLANSQFFKALSNPGNSSQEEIVTPLLWSSERQVYVLYHARRLQDQTGAFMGVTVASIAPDLFATTINQMQIQAGESIALIDPTLKLIARNPSRQEQTQIGAQLNAPSIQRILDSGQEVWSDIIWSSLDNRERFFWIQKIPDYPLWIAVGMDMDQILAQWYQRLAILVGILASIVLLGAWGVRHYVNRLKLALLLQYRLLDLEQARTRAQSGEAYLQALIHSIQDLIFVFNTQNRITYVHILNKEMTVKSDTGLLGKHYAELLPPSLTKRFNAVFEQVKWHRKAVTIEYPLMVLSGELFFQAVVSPLVRTDGSFSGTLVVARDITEAKKSEVELSIAAASFQAHLGIIITNAQGQILKANPTFTQITGYTEAEIIGRNPDMFGAAHHGPSFYRQLWRSVKKYGRWEGEVWSQRKNGDVFPEWLAISSICNADNQLTHYVATIVDISERKAAEQEIHQLAFFDSVTGLANRRLFMDRLEVALKEVVRHRSYGALLFIDIDHFKQINDVFGHPIGDRLLKGVARQLSQQLRESDTLARLGGDEFAVLIQSLDSDPAKAAQLAERIAHKLMAAIRRTSALIDHSISVSASIGITLLSHSPTGQDEYLQQADMALFQAKARGRDTLCFFDPVMQAALLASIHLERDLRQALILHQWQLYYQLQVDINGKAIGAEALLRWQHPERGLVPPGEFIPLLESTGLISEVGAWVLEKACYQLALWAQNDQLNHLTMSVNISPLQFHDVEFIPRVKAIFKRSKAPLKRLKLEVTESLFVEPDDNAHDKMLSLKALGVRFSLDDFGTGYSSLAYLAQLPLDQLKIDQTFVQQVLTSSANAAIVESTIVLAESLNLEIIAEGVETQAQQAWLLAHGCYAYQGFLFGCPVTVEEFEAQLVASQC